MKRYFVIVPSYKNETENNLNTGISDLSHKNEIRELCTIEKAFRYAENLFKADKKWNIKYIKIFRTNNYFDMRRTYICTIERASQTLIIAKKL